MTRKEDILNKPYTDNGAYSVPQGYFEDLNKRIMAQIPAPQATKKKRNIVLFPQFRYAVAACLTGLIVCAGTYIYTLQPNEKKSIAAESSTHSVSIDEYTNDCLDYAMVDKDDMYTYLAEQ